MRRFPAKTAGPPSPQTPCTRWGSKICDAVVLAADGILCGHDYHPNFPDVCNGAARSANSLGRTLHVIGSLWYLLPASLEASRT